MNEITFTGSLSVYKQSVMQSPGQGLSVVGLLMNMNGLYVTEGTILVPANLSGGISAATNVNIFPTVITTSQNHDLVTGDTVTITGMLGNTAANGTNVVTVLSPTTFSVQVLGNGNYTGGGTFTTANGCAIPLGAVTAPHISWLVNKDPDNSLFFANGQAALATPTGLLQALEQCLFPWAPTAVPWALAGGSAVILQYLICSQ